MKHFSITSSISRAALLETEERTGTRGMLKPLNTLTRQFAQKNCNGEQNLWKFGKF